MGPLYTVVGKSKSTTRSAASTSAVTPTPIPSSTPSPFPSPTVTPTPAPTATLAQRIDTYIDHLTQTQQIGQLLMLPVYTNGYTSALDQPLQGWEIANVIIYNQYNGEPLMPTTLSAFTQLVQNLHSHANQALMVATDEEGGNADRLAPYYGPTPSPQQFAATGDPQQAYAQAQLDAERMLASGINTDLAPLADVSQGGAVDQSRMFGTTPAQVITYAGAFLDGLQQHGVIGTLKHWPGIGSAPANPDYGLPTITKSQAQLNAVDFASFRALLSRQPGMIMVTHVMVPAYDPNALASLSPVLINQVLRGQLGYQGVVITDAMNGGGLLQFMQQQGYQNPTQAIAEASVRAILAGNDIKEADRRGSSSHSSLKVKHIQRGIQSSMGVNVLPNGSLVRITNYSPFRGLRGTIRRVHDLSFDLEDPLCFYLIALEGTQMKEPLWFEYEEIEVVASPLVALRASE